MARVLSARGGAFLTATLVLFGVAPAVVRAQQPTKQQQQQQQPKGPQKQELKGKGEFDALAGDKLKAQINGDTWVVQLVAMDKDPKNITKIHVTGTAEPEFLAAGMFVKFTGEFDKHGKASEEVKELEIFTPDEKNPVGANPSGNGFEEPGAKKPANATTGYEIAGRITAVKKNNITVNCGNFTAKADVAADAKIKVDTANLNWAQPQDKIDVKGWFYNKGYGVANEVNVTLANPLSGPKKRGPAHPASDKHPTATGDKPANKTDKTDKTDKADKTDDAKAGEKKAGDAKTDSKTDDAKPDDKKADAKKNDKVDAK